MTIPPVPAAPGKWTTSQETTSLIGTNRSLKVYTFHAKSGYTVVMKKEPGRPTTEPYTARITDPKGRPAEYLADDGRRISGMILHLKLRDAKLTVQENIHRAEQLAAAAP